MYNIKITDIMTGQKAFRRSVLDSIDLKENGFAVEIEITCLSFNCSRRFTEVYIPYSYRNHGVSKLVNFDGFKSLAMLFTLFLRTDDSNKQKAPQLNPNTRLKTASKLSAGHTDLRETS